MLSVYIGAENLPKDKKFVKDPQPLASDLNLMLDGYTREVLSEIEQAIPQSENTYIDRFGRGLYSTTLSTSTVILLSVNQFDDYVINGDELGNNAFALLLSADKGSIYFSDGWYDIENITLPFILNGKVCNTDQDVWEAYY